jgi:hypothetical protein
MNAVLVRVFRPLFVPVVVIQGVHVFEHVVQLMQVYAFGVPDAKALGLLGYLVQFNGTEEWLHLGFNATYLLALYVLLTAMRGLVPATLPPRIFGLFVVGGVGLETWHVVEHVVIISHVIANHGCPCPGIGDAVLRVSDTQLHFVYNAVAYVCTVVPFLALTRDRGAPVAELSPG